MREVVLRIPRIAVEDVLDRLLLIVPGGVRVSRAGAHVELRIRGPELPAAEVLEHAVGRWPHKLSEHTVADDWRARRRADYTPDVLGDRLVVRPDWAPPAEGDVIEIVLEESAAFGGGTHATTRTCLELLLELPVSGGFADLGCGTGVLAIVAARLGWAPVQAIDLQPESVEAAKRNADLNGVQIDVRTADLFTEPPPATEGFAANVPAAVQEAIAETLNDPAPRIGLLSGFGSEEAGEVLARYERRDLVPRRRIDLYGWSVAVVSRK